MDMAEFDFNIQHGESSTESDNVEAFIVDGDKEYPVSGILLKSYARKQVDGRFTTDLPLQTIALTITQNQIPSDILPSEYRLLRVRIQNEVYDVRFVTGTGFVTFTLKPIDVADLETEETGLDESGVVR